MLEWAKKGYIFELTGMTKYLELNTNLIFWPTLVLPQSCSLL